MMKGWVDYILSPNMQYMLDNYRNRHPRRAPRATDTRHQRRGDS